MMPDDKVGPFGDAKLKTSFVSLDEKSIGNVMTQPPVKTVGQNAVLKSPSR